MRERSVHLRGGPGESVQSDLAIEVVQERAEPRTYQLNVRRVLRKCQHKSGEKQVAILRRKNGCERGAKNLLKNIHWLDPVPESRVVNSRVHVREAETHR